VFAHKILLWLQRLSKLKSDDLFGVLTPACESLPCQDNEIFCSTFGLAKTPA